MNLPNAPTPPALLRNEELASIMDLLLQRAEHAPDDERLVATFVDPGVLEKVPGGKNHIVYGRRGTGKTHLLKFRAREIARSGARVFPVYIDLSNTGDTLLAGYRAGQDDVTGLLVHVLESLRQQLRDSLERREGEIDSDLGDRFDQIERLIHAVEVRDASLTSEQERIETSSEKGSLSGVAGLRKLELGAEHTEDASESARARTTASGRAVAFVDFTALNRALAELLPAARIDSVLLILDEWSDVDPDIQPDLADFILRAFMKNPRFAVKIGAIEYRSNFSRRLERNRVVGFEHGSDIAQGVDLDSFFSIDGNPQRVTRLFSTLLFRHICVAAAWNALDRGDGTSSDKLPRRLLYLLGAGRAEDVDEVVKELAGLVKESDTWGSEFMQRVGTDYMVRHFQTKDDEAFRTALFDSGPPPAFEEMVLASGGVVRDFIKVFVRAFDNAKQSQEQQTIDLPAVRHAAVEVYFAEKVKNLQPSQERDLEELLDLTLRQSGTPYFAIPSGAPWSERVKGLLDLRTVHRVHRGYTDPDNPGRRQDVYSLDFAAYASRLGPNEGPGEHFPESRERSRRFARFTDGREVEVAVLDA